MGGGSRQKSLVLYSLCILSVIVNIFKISRADLHYDIIVKSYEEGWYFFDINGKRGPIDIHW